MRSSLSQTARQLQRNATRLRYQPRRIAGARWSSSDAGEEGHKWSTPLAKQLAEAVTTTGPIPVASYMRQCLTSDLGGYYTATSPAHKDQFGAKGDFVTSPEISQIFGELLGIWFIAEWASQGRKSEGVYLMEMGPGRGTLVDDMLRTIRNFKPFAEAIEAVYLVEASASLREAQHKLLCGDNPLQQNDIGHESISRHSPDLKIVWAEDLRLVPRQADKTPFVVAHEFFDALPIHVFQSVPPSPQSQNEGKSIRTPTGPILNPRKQQPGNQWRELLVSPKAPHHLKEDEPEFELTLSKGATPHSMYLPELSRRYQAARKIDGATIEISPESQAFARDLAVRLGGSSPSQPTRQPATTAQGRTVTSASIEEPLQKSSPSGAALIIDYGPAATIPTSSLRGIKSHTMTSPFSSPGTTDISADVDFLALAEAALDASPGVEVHGPLDQARFLRAMGIEERAAQLVKRAVDRERGGKGGAQEKGELTELVKRVESGWKRLVDTSPNGMGKLYNVMALLPYTGSKPGEQRRRPVGFGGDVQM